MISLFQTKRSRRSSSRQARDHLRALHVLVLAAEREQALLDPVRRAGSSLDAAGVRQEQRDRLGQVADGVVALLEEPVGNAGLRRGPGAQLARSRPAAWAAGR